MRNFYFLFLALNILSNFILAESHREPSVLLSDRAIEELQVIREDGYLYSKELVREGFRTTIRGSSSKPIADSKTFSDFVSKKFCSAENDAHLLIAYTSGNLKKASQSCNEVLDGKDVSKNTEGQTLLCKYSCKNASLDSLQNLFFENFVRYIEPNVSRELN